jgi:DNA-binding SARP family transcriptional activator
MGDARLEVRVLGPIELSWQGRPLEVGGIKTRALIARLLIDRNITVSVDRLLEDIWTSNEGEGAEIALRSTVSRLRKRLRDAGVEHDLIVTRPPGYVLEVERAQIDVARFETMVAEGRSLLASDQAERAVAVLQEGLALWRGPAFGEVRDESFAQAESRRLEELRLSATETRVQAELILGRHNDLVGELESLTRANPMREALWGQRMLALYRAGRQGEALRVYQELRTMLVDEMGIDPGPEVAQLEQEILAQRPELMWQAPPMGAVPEVGAPLAPPVEVPEPDTTESSDALFVGRTSELDEVRRWWAQVRRGGPTLLLIAGDPGIGKTRLTQRLVEELHSQNSIVLWGRCDEDPVGPYQPFAEALGRYFQTLPTATIAAMPAWRLTELARLILKLRKFAPPRDTGDAVDPSTERFRFFEAVADMLSELSSDHRVLVVLDDLHWADRPTLLLLRHLLRNSDASGPAVIGLYRDSDVDPDHALKDFLTDLRTEIPPARLTLRGLSQGAVQELVNSQGSSDLGIAQRLFDMTDGNPLMVDELIHQIGFGAEAAVDGQSPIPPELGTPEAVKELVARRVSRLPEEVIQFLWAAAVAGPEFEASIVATAAGLSPEERLDAIDRAVESRLTREIGDGLDRYAFTHSLMRDAIYDELLRGRRVRLHHKIASAIEEAHPDAKEQYLNELAHHFCMGAELADADKAVEYAFAAGERAARLLAFEEAVGHYTRGMEVAERFGKQGPATRCDALLALAEAQKGAGDEDAADINYGKASALARSLNDAERLARAALRSGPLSYIGVPGAKPELAALLEEARAALGPDDEHLRSMLTARLGLVTVYAEGLSGQDLVKQAGALCAEAIAIARRSGDRAALGYALNARLHALWGIDPAPERLAVGTELGKIADEVNDEMLALHGHMWRVRELLAQGDIEAVNREIERFDVRDAGPRHPLASSFVLNVRAMMALIRGEIDEGDRLAVQAMELATGYNELALPYYAAQMSWTWWQQERLPELEPMFRQVLAEAPADYPVVSSALALLCSEIGKEDEARVELDRLAQLGWDYVAQDQTEGVAMAMTASVIGKLREADYANALYERMRPLAGTAIVIRAPAAACFGPADQYLGLLAMGSGDLSLAEVHFDAAVRLSERMRAEPFTAAAQVQLAGVLVQAGRASERDRVTELLGAAGESARRIGLPRIERLAKEVQESISG